MDIRAKQTEALVRLLHPPASDDDDDPSASSAYRVLILDAFTKDVIAPLLRVGDLRRHGVSLHLQLRALRDPIPDAPAVYFVSGRENGDEASSSPSQSVVDVIARDAARGLYSKMHLNFCGGLAKGGLERLAAAVVAADASNISTAAAAATANGAPAPPPAPVSALSRIGRVVDQHLAFVALEPGLFTLRQKKCYVSLHDPAAPPSAVEGTVALVAEGLFSALATLGVTPLIRCPKGGPAQAVAVALDARLREAARASSRVGGVGGAAAAGGGAAAAALAASAASSSSAASRPLLVIFDRSVDMAACLQHGWTYKPLVADVLGLDLNRVALPQGGAAGAGNGAAAAAAVSTKTVEVGPADFFWEANGSSPFPAVAEEVDTQLKRYKAAVEEVNRNAASGGNAAGAPQIAALQSPSSSSSSTASLAAAVASLPELAERKRMLDRHTNIATLLLHAIKARGLDAWHAAEEDVVSGLGGGIGGAAGAAAGNLGAVVGGGVAAVASRVGVTSGAASTSAEEQQQQRRRNESVLERLLRGEKGSASDRTRAALVWAAAASPVPTDEEFLRVEAALRDGGGDCVAFAYIRRLRKLNLAGNASAAAAAATAAPATSSSSAAGGVLSWADKALGAGVASLARGVRGLLAPGERPSPLVAALEGLSSPPPPPPQQPSALSSISDPSAAAATAAADLDTSFATYDPRLPAGAPARRGPGGFSDVVAFVVGGGSYLEREALSRWASRGASSGSSSSAGKRRVVYGATELLSGEEFAAQLGELARRSGLA